LISSSFFIKSTPSLIGMAFNDDLRLDIWELVFCSGSGILRCFVAFANRELRL
jgi:hypothetical protein